MTERLPVGRNTRLFVSLERLTYNYPNTSETPRPTMDENDYLNADESDIETDDDALVDETPEVETPPPPPADHVVHVYEFGKFHRTIERPFAAEEAEAFASEYNRTAKSYGRFALAGKEKARAKKTVPWPTGAAK